MRTLRRGVAIAAVLGVLGLGSAQANWETARTTSPENVTELRELQERVKSTTQKVMPSTVGLLVGFGAGSGVIVSDDGLILTAAHVIGKPGSKIMVVLSDGTKVQGVALGLNARQDSGMAKITSSVPENADWPGASEGKWPKAELGDSKSLKKGQWVISLGHHGGPKQERTPPLRVGRFEFASTGNEKILRSDCTLVGGDSGGPLFDLDGKVVGIHSKIGIFIDQNMHVPVNTYRDEWERLAASEDIGRAPAGLGLELNAEEDKPTVQKVERGSAAARGGLRVGDVITKFDDVEVNTRQELKNLLAKVRAGEEVEIEVERNNQTLLLTVILGTKPKPEPEKEKDK